MSGNNSISSVFAEIWMRGLIRAESSFGSRDDHSLGKTRRYSLPHLTPLSLPTAENSTERAIIPCTDKSRTDGGGCPFTVEDKPGATLTFGSEALLRREHLSVSTTDSPRSSVSAQTVVYDPREEKMGLRSSRQPVATETLPDDLVEDEEKGGRDDQADQADQALLSSVLAESAGYGPAKRARGTSLTPTKLTLSCSQASNLSSRENACSSRYVGIDEASGELQNPNSTGSKCSLGSSSDRSKQCSTWSLDQASPKTSSTEAEFTLPEISKSKAHSALESPTSLTRDSPPRPGPDSRFENTNNISEMEESLTNRTDRYMILQPVYSEKPAISVQADISRRPGYLQQPESPSNASISRVIMDTRLPSSRMEANDIRRLDGIEVVDGIELATQNTDGKPVPEMEAEQINDLSTPPEAQYEPCLINAMSGLGCSSKTDRLRAADPPPPPNYDPDQIRKIHPRSANHGRSLSQSHFTGDDSTPITKIKNRLVDVKHRVQNTVQGSHEPHHEEIQADLVPRSEVRGPGSIPESVVLGPSKLRADELLSRTLFVPPDDEDCHEPGHIRDVPPSRNKYAGLFRATYSPSPIPEGDEKAEEISWPVEFDNHKVDEPPTKSVTPHGQASGSGTLQGHEEVPDLGLVEADRDSIFHMFGPGVDRHPTLTGHDLDSTLNPYDKFCFDFDVRRSSNENGSSPTNTTQPHTFTRLRHMVKKLIPGGLNDPDNERETNDDLKSVSSADAALPPDIWRDRKER